jgi:hypothetical protein
MMKKKDSMLDFIKIVKPCDDIMDDLVRRPVKEPSYSERGDVD